jgi:hypothetical protein
MNTTLLTNGYIPLTSPYTDARVVGAIPVGAVDWVYIQLRETSSGAAVSSRSAFLKSNGYLMDDGGSEKILMPLPTGGEGNYYIVVRHRNHLAIMSAGTHYFGANDSTVYDFTTALSKAYGTNPMKLLATGIYGLITGDADGSGGINSADRGLVYAQRDLAGYKDTDVNLSGGVNSADRGLAYTNRDLFSQVP